MSFFNKISQGAKKLYKNATGNNSIFNKISTGLRKGDNTLQRIGAFIQPYADRIGAGETLKSGLNQIHDWRQYAVNESNMVKNGLEKSGHVPISEINRQNYA